MKDFIYGLYSNDNFTTYLVIALIVLVVLFVIVLLFGKKDQKLEETKRLQKIELDKSMPKENPEAFKEEKIEPVKLETPIEPVIKVEPEPVVVPTSKPIIENTKEVNVRPTTDVTSFFDDTQIMPTVETNTPIVDATIPMPEETVNVTTFEPMPKVEPVVEPKIELPKEEPISIFENDEESPITINDLPSYAFDDNKMEQDLTELESIKNEFNNIKIPEVEEKVEEPKVEEPKKVFKPSPVFSSVFVSNNEESIVKPQPAPAKVEENKEEPVTIFKFEDDDEDTIELPSLK